MATNQGDRQASVRAVTGTTWTYEGDWHALFDAASIASGTFNGRLLAWINLKLSTSYTELNGAMYAYAASQGAKSWNEMGTFTAGGAVAPTITSSATQTIAENSAFSLSLTADQTVTWSIVGGPDAALFNIASSTLGASAFDYEAPVDAGANNVYNITVRATNTVSGLYADQAMTITVTDVSDTSLLDGSESDGTNLLSTTSSIGLTANWTTSSSTLTSAQTTAPDGAVTAASFVDAVASDRHIIYASPNYTSPTLTSNTPYSLSIYAKPKGTFRYLVMFISGGSGETVYAYFDTQTGVVTDSGTTIPGANTAVVSTAIAAAVNSFNKCTLRFKFNGTSDAGYVVLALSTRSTYALDTAAGLVSGSPSYTGDGTSGLYLWRPKLVA